MKRGRSEHGFALVAGLLVLLVIAGLALALLLLTNSGQKAALREQASESAFNVAEAGLNAQVGQLSRAWPAKASQEVPLRCTASTTSATNGCPTGSILSTNYPNISPAQCAAGTRSDAWGSSLTNEWTTYVRDDAAKNSSYFNSAAEQPEARFDANGDGKLWVRSVGVVQCRIVVLTTLVSRESIAVPFPKQVDIANWFETRNRGGHGERPIVNTQGESSQTTNVVVRCSPPPEGKPCENYEKEKGQVSPGGVVEEKATGPAISSGTLETLRQEAEAEGTYYAAGSCPEKQMPAGKLVYVEGPCNVTNGPSNEVANSATEAGFLIIANGTFKINNKATFYGVVYCLNKQGSTGAVIETSGNAKIVGAAVVEGSGGASFDANGENIIYDPEAIETLKTYGGAAATRNGFHILASNE